MVEILHAKKARSARDSIKLGDDVAEPAHGLAHMNVDGDVVLCEQVGSPQFSAPGVAPWAAPASEKNVSHKYI